MATATNIVLSIVRNVANANVTVTYNVYWSAFDQSTNLQYTESVRLIGDDTGQDGDNGVVGDDSIFTGLVLFPPVISSNGQAVTARSRTFIFAFANLDEDGTLPAPDNDDEIRALVALTPRLPVPFTAESNLVTVNA